jgi:hypothetical protein
MKDYLKSSNRYDWEFTDAGDKAIICRSLNLPLQRQIAEAQLFFPGHSLLQDAQTFRWASEQFVKEYGNYAETEMHRLIKMHGNSQLRAKVFLTALTGYLNRPEDIKTDFETLPARIAEYQTFTTYEVNSRNMEQRVAAKTEIRRIADNSLFALLVFNGNNFEQQCAQIKQVLPAALMALAQAEDRINLKISVPSAHGHAGKRGGPS